MFQFTTWVNVEKMHPRGKLGFSVKSLVISSQEVSFNVLHMSVRNISSSLKPCTVFKAFQK